MRPLFVFDPGYDYGRGVPLPRRIHGFELKKPSLIRNALLASGEIREADFTTPEPVELIDLATVHTEAVINATGTWASVNENILRIQASPYRFGKKICRPQTRWRWNQQGLAWIFSRWTTRRQRPREGARPKTSGNGQEPSCESAGTFKKSGVHEHLLGVEIRNHAAGPAG